MVMFVLGGGGEGGYSVGVRRGGGWVGLFCCWFVVCPSCRCSAAVPPHPCGGVTLFFLAAICCFLIFPRGAARAFLLLVLAATPPRPAAIAGFPMLRDLLAQALLHRVECISCLSHSCVASDAAPTWMFSF
jgi:hypothetical protein